MVGEPITGSTCQSAPRALQSASGVLPRHTFVEFVHLLKNAIEAVERLRLEGAQVNLKADDRGLRLPVEKKHETPDGDGGDYCFLPRVHDGKREAIEPVDDCQRSPPRSLRASTGTIIRHTIQA